LTKRPPHISTIEGEEWPLKNRCMEDKKSTERRTFLKASAVPGRKFLCFPPQILLSFLKCMYYPLLMQSDTLGRYICLLSAIKLKGKSEIRNLNNY
jgi:hypothetical protein